MKSSRSVSVQPPTGLRWVLSFVVVAAACTAAAGAPGQTGADAGGLRIGVANPAYIFQNMLETKDLKSRMDEDRKSLEGEQARRGKEVEEARRERGLYKPDSPQYPQKNKEYLEKTLQLNVWFEMMKLDMTRKQKLEMKALYDKIEKATAEVAVQKGLLLVVAEQRPEFPENLDDITVDVLRQVINSRNVLYKADKVDISDAVVVALDSKYKK